MLPLIAIAGGALVQMGRQWKDANKEQDRSKH
jgi:hypothetical protein